ncbi:MAG: carbonic anhydrase [Rhodospirillaceae bacterium]|nr:carbonic anhydrase [Rhodospirillaceae bacterium]
MPDKPDSAPIERLLAGIRGFRSAYYEQRPERLRPIVERGQAPEVLVIACSDSRVDPALLTNAEPGELFVVRNVANLVPPYCADGTSRGTSAAIEFAVRDLGVRHVIVLGHSGCGGIRALIDHNAGKPLGRDFIAPWVGMVAHVCSQVPRGTDFTQNPRKRERAIEQRAILASLDNLRAFPWVAERIEAGTLNVRGWWFDLDEGALWEAHPPAIEFERLPL